MKFSKLHGLGNDFVVVEARAFDEAARRTSAKAMAQALADRHRGVGADQILVLEGQGPGKARMVIYNADGSRAEMCGNGIRAAALWMQQQGWAAQERIDFDTAAGPKVVQALGGGRFRVDMGVPEVQAALDVQVGVEEFTCHPVSMGNPHAVIFTDKVDKIRLEAIGPKLEGHEHFPGRTNVEFVEVAGPQALRVRVWERGAGATLACGTGACAAAVAALTLGRVQRGAPVRVTLPGGDLEIEWPGPGQPVLMSGPATYVFDGELKS